MSDNKFQIGDRLSLGNFRNELNEEMLEWGFIYFNNGWVKPGKEIMPGLFTCVVEEPNPQEVSFRRWDGGLSDLFCSCGETKYKYCRHIAAVLFHEEEKNNREDAKSRRA